MNIVIWILIVIVAGWSSFMTSPTPAAAPVSRPATPVCVGSATRCDGDTEWQVVRIGNVEGVVVPEDEARDLAAWGTSDPIEGTWQPDKADIEELESHIEEAAAHGSSPSQQPRPESLDGYVRQYAGIIENGEKKIFVNGMCHVDSDAWKHEPYIVMDGGPCYFTAVYNVETEEFELFRYNGDA
ncbi:MAG: hypothetical protein WBA63_15905 [Thermomicrobiales bacterium]